LSQSLSASAVFGALLKMRVLLLHNRYRAPGGEERSVTEIAALLHRNGHEVELLERSSADVTKERAAVSLVEGGRDPNEVAVAARRMRADVVHVHNLHPLFGWRALEAAQAVDARTVLHLHNFRLYCAIGIAYRNGVVCHSCHGRNTLAGLLHRCRGDAREAAIYAESLRRQQRRILRFSDRIVVPSTAHREALSELGLKSDEVGVVTNFIPDDGWVSTSGADRGAYALFAGRLVPEKGADTAIAAARAAGVPLVIAGSGPDEARLRQLAEGADVRFTGWVEGEELAGLRAGAAVALLPSRWQEPLPFAALEAVSAGLPLLASDLGGLPEVVAGSGLQPLPAGDVDAWTTALAALWNDREGRRSTGEAALKAARARYGEAAAYRQLLAAYQA
jgi:glycosyltransferase involved in cell wall biosynthesis